ncbi:DNA-directed RNA polymerase subunit E'' [Patescibacteria group bacterium]|nr:DNA-directed RNA polymerase subunit E'' [Patescibacteria group bacterium]
MVKQRACKICNRIFEGEKCPNCDSKDFTEGFKGRVYIIDPEKSEIAKKLNLKVKGNHAVKTR